MIEEHKKKLLYKILMLKIPLFLIVAKILSLNLCLFGRSNGTKLIRKNWFYI